MTRHWSLTIDPGDAGYFVVPVTNDWTITDNYWDQQTSLNISQATKESRWDLHDRDLADRIRRLRTGYRRAD